jgi:hypothetical protein
MPKKKKPAGKKSVRATASSAPIAAPPFEQIASDPIERLLGRTVQVKVRIVDGRLKVQPKRVRLSLDAQQQALWLSQDGAIEIRFSPADSPFTGAAYSAPAGAVLLSGRLRPGTVRVDGYKYSVLLTTPSGVIYLKDPDVVVDI